MSTNDKLRFGGRCQKHPLNILPCEKCAKGLPADCSPGVFTIADGKISKQAVDSIAASKPEPQEQDGELPPIEPFFEKCGKGTAYQGDMIKQAMRDYARAALLAEDKAGGEAVGCFYVRNGFAEDPEVWTNAAAGLKDGEHYLYTHSQPQTVPDDVVKDAEITEKQAVELFRKHEIFLYPMRPEQCLALVRDAAMLKEARK